ncbi:MAG: DUF4349 domain-containing protein [Clostridia bacterium]|nr:DUF4349 domain-containing protein [Clostridia bacterium]
MRNCSEYQDMMNLYIDGLLDDSEQTELLKHVDSCPECRRELEMLQEVVGMFKSLNEEELIPPASFRRELRRKLEKEEKVKRNNFLNKFNKFVNKTPVKKWMPMAAAAVLLLVLVPVLSSGLGFLGSKSFQETADMKKAEAPQSTASGYGAFNSMANTAVPERESYQFKMAMDGEQSPEMHILGTVEEESKVTAPEGPVERKIIKTAHLDLEVDSIKTTAEQIKNMVNEMQGYIVSENTYVYDDQRKLLAGNVSLRVPQERFDEALNRIESMGVTQNRTIDAQDVTEEYVDVESRLKAMRLKEERLLAILNKSGSLGDVLAVENELARTRADLEALQGRLKYLDNRTELSTINVSVRETLTPVKQIKTTGLQGVLGRTQEAFIKSINTIIIGFGNLIVLVGAYLPFTVLAVILLIGLWAASRKVKNKLNK